MACPTTVDPCDCLVQTKGNCTFYQGVTLTCDDLVITKGDDYDSILADLVTAICNIDPPSGAVYTGTTGQIDVTGTVISLSNTILTQLSNIESDIAALEVCMPGAVKAITTSTSGMTITQTATSSCGRTLNINYIPPVVPASAKGGVIYNLTTSTNIPSGYEWTQDFTSYGLVTGDVIKIKGTLRRTSAQTSNQQFTIYDGGFVTNTFLANGGLNNIGTAGFSFTDFEIFLSVVSNVAGVLTVKTQARMTDYGGALNYLSNPIKTPIPTFAQFITPLSISVTNLKLAFVNTDVPVMEQFIVELIRKI